MEGDLYLVVNGDLCGDRGTTPHGKVRNNIIMQKTTSNYHYTPYSARMSQENTHKLMGFYMEVLILGVIHN